MLSAPFRQLKNAENDAVIQYYMIKKDVYENKCLFTVPFEPEQCLHPVKIHTDDIKTGCDNSVNKRNDL